MGVNLLQVAPDTLFCSRSLHFLIDLTCLAFAPRCPDDHHHATAKEADRLKARFFIVESIVQDVDVMTSEDLLSASAEIEPRVPAASHPAS